jgi:NTP pyrophosphatase (non-canonical NTP hydrolase)
MRQLREVADFQRQVREAMRSVEMVPLQDVLHDVQEAMKQHRSIAEELQRGGILRHLQEVDELRDALRTHQLDLESAAQEVLDMNQQIKYALSGAGLELAAELAELHSTASLDVDLMAQITEQLDAEHFAQTLRRCRELLYDDAIAETLAHADMQTIIRDAEEAMDVARSAADEFIVEVKVGPPEWLQHLSRENLRILIKLLILYIETLYACYCVSLALSDGNVLDGNMSDSEVQAVVHVLLTTLGWAYFLLENGKNDN